MAQTIIDALVVLLKLNADDFTKGRKEFVDGIGKTREATGKAGADIDTFSKRSAEGIGKLRNEALGLFLAFQGASSVKGFLTDLITNDAATGRLAANIGLSVNRLSAWQLAVKDAGGTAKDADQALSSMSEAYQSYLLTGTTGKDADLKGLGLSLGDLQNPEQALLKMAEAAERMDRTEFFARTSRLGLPPSVINTLEQGRAATEALVRQKEADAAITQKETEQAQKLQAAIADLEAKITGKLRPAIYQIVEGLSGMTDSTEAANVAVPILVGLLGAAAIAATAAYAPFLALAGVIAGAVAVYEKWQALDALPDKKKEEWAGRSAKNRNDAWAAFNTNEDISIFERMRRAAGILGRNLDPSTYAIPGSGGGAGTGKGGGGAPSGNGSVSSLYNVLEADLGRDRARGVWAGVGAESKWNPNAVNPTSGAFGLGQWVGARKKALFAKYGPNPSAADQVQFLLSELHGGDPGGKSVLGQATTEGTIVSYLRDFMRPQGAHNEHYGDLVSDVNRARGYAGLSAARAPAGAVTGGGTRTTTVSIGNMTVHTAATDADGIGAALPGAIQKRGLTNQANRGLD